MSRIKRLIYLNILVSHAFLNQLLCGLLLPCSIEASVLKVPCVTKSPLSPSQWPPSQSPLCYHRASVASSNVGRSRLHETALPSVERCTEEKPLVVQGIATL